jgi:hypothetical protein
MCSTASGQLARICRAIEELAGRSAAAGSAPASAIAEPGQAAAPEAGQGAAEDDLAARLAAIWAMVAEADPELARRLRGYLAAPE